MDKGIAGLHRFPFFLLNDIFFFLFVRDFFLVYAFAHWFVVVKCEGRFGLGCGHRPESMSKEAGLSEDSGVQGSCI